MSRKIIWLFLFIGCTGVILSIITAKTWIPVITILALAFVQNVSFTIVSRSRNRDNLNYHLIASIFSNGVWFLTFRELVLREMNFVLFIPYTVGTVAGSLLGQKISKFPDNINADCFLRARLNLPSVVQGSLA